MEDFESEHVKGTVSSTLTFFQSILAVIVILEGFVFAALIRVLSPDGGQAVDRVNARLLLMAMVLLLASLVSYLVVAHQLIKYCRILLPAGRVTALALSCLLLGFLATMASVGWLLWQQQMTVDALALVVAALVLCAMSIAMREIHADDRYRVNMDNLQRQPLPPRGRCPYCLEWNHLAALVCRECGRGLGRRTDAFDL